MIEEVKTFGTKKLYVIDVKGKKYDISPTKTEVFFALKKKEAGKERNSEVRPLTRFRICLI